MTEHTKGMCLNLIILKRLGRVQNINVDIFGMLKGKTTIFENGFHK